MDRFWQQASLGQVVDEILILVNLEMHPNIVACVSVFGLNTLEDVTLRASLFSALTPLQRLLNTWSPTSLLHCGLLYCTRLC